MAPLVTTAEQHQHNCSDSAEQTYFTGLSHIIQPNQHQTLASKPPRCDLYCILLPYALTCRSIRPMALSLVTAPGTLPQPMQPQNRRQRLGSQQQLILSRIETERSKAHARPEPTTGSSANCPRFMPQLYLGLQPTGAGRYRQQGLLRTLGAIRHPPCPLASAGTTPPQTTPSHGWGVAVSQQPKEPHHHTPAHTPHSMRRPPTPHLCEPDRNNSSPRPRVPATHTYATGPLPARAVHSRRAAATDTACGDRGPASRGACTACGLARSRAPLTLRARGRARVERCHRGRS